MLPDKRNRLSYHQIIASVKYTKQTKTSKPITRKGKTIGVNHFGQLRFVWPSSYLQSLSPSLSTFIEKEHGKLGNESILSANNIIKKEEKIKHGTNN